MYFSKKTQIFYLKMDEAFIKVYNKYTDLTNIFLLKLAIKFFDHTKINNYTIKLVDDQ